jgi:hypothetical protein
MSYTVPKKTDSDAPNLPTWVERWSPISETADTVTVEIKGTQPSVWAIQMADLLNDDYVEWSNVTESSPVLIGPVLKQALYAVKKGYSQAPDPVPQGYYLSYDNGTDKGLWRAEADVTKDGSNEPDSGSNDWQLVYSL